MSRTVYRSLLTAFGEQPPDLVAHVLTLAVLFEDLRFELTSLDRERPMPNVYFIRRSFATIREFADCLSRLDGLASFQPLRKSFDRRQRGVWNTAVGFMNAQKQRIQDERNAYGAHVAVGDVQKAFEQWPTGYDSTSFEAQWTETEAETLVGVRFGFAADVMARVFLRGRKDDNQDEREYFHSLIVFADEAFVHATSATNIIADMYVAPRFGFRR